MVMESMNNVLGQYKMHSCLTCQNGHTKDHLFLTIISFLDLKKLAMIELFHQMHHVSYNGGDDTLNEDEVEFYEFAKDRWLCDFDGNEFEKHLPIPVYSYLKPSMGPQFLLHVLLSMGRFAT